MSADEISSESRMVAAQVREKAAGMPSAEQIAGLAADALGSHPESMSPADIRALAAETISKAQRVSYLLGRLAGLLDDEGRCYEQQGR